MIRETRLPPRVRRSEPPPPRGEHMLIKKRMEVIFIVFLGCILVLGLRLADLQGLKSRGFMAVADKMQTRKLDISAHRGRIKDRNNTELAIDTVAKAIDINPRMVQDVDATSARLASLLKLSEAQEAEIKRRLVAAKKVKSAYNQLRRGVDRKLALRIEELGKKEPALAGIWTEDWPIRVHPAGADASQIIGPVNADGNGLEGIELKFDSILQGQKGWRTVRVSATGAPIPETETESEDPVDGKDVQLTIDRDIQHFTEAEVYKVAREQNPNAVTAMVMDVHNGHLLAVANWPSYRLGDKVVRPEQMKNRAVTDLFEPGSIFKVLTAAVALETKVNTNVYCGGTRAIGNKSIHCAHGERHGAVDLKKMVQHSCNIAAGTIAERIGPKRFYTYLDKFGIQKKTGVEFPGESYARLDPPAKWRTMRTVNMGFGQGVVATPIQMLAAYAAIANDGVYNPPQLVISAPGAKLPERKPTRVIDAANAVKVRQCMEAVVTEGTGKAAKIAGYSVAGKTGTAQIAEHGHYVHNAYVASFVGCVPAKKPRLAILVSVWHPRKDQYGGVVSAPVFREIARQSVAFLKIPPDAPNDPVDGARKSPVAKSKGGGVKQND